MCRLQPLTANSLHFLRINAQMHNLDKQKTASSCKTLALIADRPQSTFFGQNAAFLIQTNFTKLEQTFVNMTSKTLKKKVIEYINHAEDNVIEAVYKMLKIYEDSDGKSLMTTEQKSEIERRSALFRQGKLKTSSWSDVKKRTRTT